MQTDSDEVSEWRSVGGVASEREGEGAEGRHCV